jgi:hypothetical protein
MITERTPKLRWRTLKADMHSPYEKRQELYLGTAYIGVVEPCADGAYLARAQNGGPHETFGTIQLAKDCLEVYARSLGEADPTRG